MKTLARYLSREVAASTLLVFAALLMLFSFFDLINELRDLGQGNYRLGRVLLYVLLNAPGHAYELAPIAALIGTLTTLSVLVANSEYTVMRTGGASLTQIAGAIGRVGVGLMLATFLLGELVAPASEQLAQQVRLQAIKGMVAHEFRSGFWFKQDRTFVNVQHVLPTNTLMGVRIFEFSVDWRLTDLRFVEFAGFLGERQWRLQKVTRTHFGEDGARISRQDEEIWDTVLAPAMFDGLQVAPEMLSIGSLYQNITHLSQNNQKSSRFEIAFWTKALYPASILVLMFMAIPFAQFKRRSAGLGWRVFAGIMLGLGFLLLNRLFSYLGLLYDWLPILSALLPSLVFLAAAGALLWRIERR
ncbi:MAG: LPS export ABC transporter permease LptG [Betaproteobacteria bacterium]|nr:LPS export ABC transporter permease LptG [Betaproteobacteria bacterium]